jgi:hypothetical protein
VVAYADDAVVVENEVRAGLTDATPTLVAADWGAGVMLMFALEDVSTV